MAAAAAPPPGLALPSFPQHRVAVRYATEHRCGVVVRGPGLCDAISGTDPLKDGLPLLAAAPLDDSHEVRRRAGQQLQRLLQLLARAVWRTALPALGYS